MALDGDSEEHQWQVDEGMHLTLQAKGPLVCRCVQYLHIVEGL